MILQPHIDKIFRLSSYYIRIGKIRKFLDKSATEKVIHALVTSRLDNSNALLYTLPNNQISHFRVTSLIIRTTSLIIIDLIDSSLILTSGRVVY